MWEGYSLNVDVGANGAIPFNSVSLDKGCAERQVSPDTIALDKCGVYEVCCNASAAAAQTIQLYKDGVAQPQAQATGTSPAFRTFVQVNHNNTCCPCSSPTLIRLVSEDATTYTVAHMTVNKLDL